jgi:WD40 repeat protein
VRGRAGEGVGACAGLVTPSSLSSPTRNLINTLAHSHLLTAPPQNGSRDGSERGGPTLTATLVQVLRGHTNSVHSVVWTKDGSGVVSGALDNTVRVWDLRGAAKREREGKKGMGMAEVGCTVFAGHKVRFSGPPHRTGG